MIEILIGEFKLFHKKVMLSEDLKNWFVAAKVELSDLNILAAFYLRKFSRLQFLVRNSTRQHMLEELTSLRYMENGIIMHLTNLDDDSGAFSFIKIRKQLLREMKDQGQIKIINQKMKSFRANLDSFKNKHRNKRIAHLNSINELDYDSFLNFDTEVRPLIIEANRLGDIFWGKYLEHKFKYGSIEGFVEFRKEAESGEFNFSLKNDFS